MELTVEEIRYYQMSGGDQRKTVRAALKRWRERNPDKLPVTSLHHGWYGWVLESTEGERGIVANVMRDCIAPYLREMAESQCTPQDPEPPPDGWNYDGEYEPENWGSDDAQPESSKRRIDSTPDLETPWIQRIMTLSAQRDALADVLEAIFTEIKGRPEWLSYTSKRALLGRAGEVLRATGRKAAADRVIALSCSPALDKVG